MGNKSDIGTYFKEELETISGELSPIEIDELEYKMKKINFYKPSFSNFNIYYSGLMLSTFLLCCYTTGHYFYHFEKYKTNNVELKNDVITSLNSKISYLDSAEEVTIKEDKKVVESIVKEVKPSGFQGVEKLRTAPSIILKKIDPENLPVLLVEKTEVKNHEVKIEPVKELSKNKLKDTVVIHLQDTIFEFDTLKVKKGRKH